MNGETEAQAGEAIVQGGIVGLEPNSLADTSCLVETYQGEVLGFEPLSLRAQGKYLESAMGPPAFSFPLSRVLALLWTEATTSQNEVALIRGC